MTARRCAVSFIDENGIEHCAEVLVESVYEAAALALKSFNADPFIHEKPHERTALKVSVIAPSAEHALRVEQLRRWVRKHRARSLRSYNATAFGSLLGMPI
jgi:hypothetical protein